VKFHIKYRLGPPFLQSHKTQTESIASTKPMSITSPRQQRGLSSGATDRYCRAARRKTEYYSGVSL